MAKKLKATAVTLVKPAVTIPAPTPVPAVTGQNASPGFGAPMPMDNEFLQNQVDWMLGQMEQISVVLKMPADKTMKDLLWWAGEVMKTVPKPQR
jgi:hypothetical protein